MKRTEYQKEWYRQNAKRQKKLMKKWREGHISQRKEYGNRWNKENKKAWKRFLKSMGYGSCSECENKEGRRIDCHHVDPGTKVFNISNFCNSHPITELNMEMLKLELSKCISLCVSCHRRLHARECGTRALAF